MKKSVLVQLYRDEDADCTGGGRNNTVVIGDEIVETCACGNGCEGTFDIRNFLNDVTGVVNELEDIEEGIDYVDEEDEEEYDYNI